MTPIEVPDPDPAELLLNARAQARSYAIAKRNAKFYAASPAEQRVTIAKDVLTWLRLKKLVPVAGQYLTEMPGTTPKEDDRVNGDSCHACALGALFACAVERQPVGVTNFWNEPNNVGNSFMHKHLQPYFDEKQLGLIEAAFECRHMWATEAGNDTDAATRAFNFGMNAGSDRLNGSDAAKRMEAIMRNIIKNSGEFKP